jgi:hypothetical protein
LTYEDAVTALGGPKHVNAKLIDFVQPVEQTESQLAEILGSMQNSGKLVFLHGRPGTGKSTFIQSLSWRTHLRLSMIEPFDASEHSLDKALDRVLESVRELGVKAKRKADVGTAALVVNYLEHLAGVPAETVKGFFRSLNGILRNNRLLILWPVTALEDAETMMEEASRITGTMFHPGKEILEFSGPPASEFPTITKNTVAVLNDGKLLEDFGLTSDDLDEALTDLRDRGVIETTIRNYLAEVQKRWEVRTNQLETIRKSIPKPTEIWFVLSHKEAESVAETFARKSPELNEVWRANHGKLYEYIHDTQRAADWDAKRLQFAIGGAFTCRIFYMPTNTLVSVIAAYGKEPMLSKLGLRALSLPKSWFTRRSAQRLLATTPLLRQLKGEKVKFGKRRSGTVATSLATAQPGFDSIASFASGNNGGSDEPLNHALAGALQDALGTTFTIETEQPHPWLPNIIPDVRVDTPSGRHVCIEMFYSNRTRPSVAAEYILNKLDRYMRQLESKVGKVS